MGPTHMNIPGFYVFERTPVNRSSLSRGPPFVFAPISRHNVMGRISAVSTYFCHVLSRDKHNTLFSESLHRAIIQQDPNNSLKLQWSKRVQWGPMMQGSPWPINGPTKVYDQTHEWPTLCTGHSIHVLIEAIKQFCISY